MGGEATAFTREQLHAVRRELEQALVGIGVFDGDEVGFQEALLYMYGASASDMAASIIPVLQRYDLPVGTVAKIRRGGPEAAEETLQLRP